MTDGLRLRSPRRFSRPVLLVWGARDTNFGAAIAARLARDFPTTRGLVLLERSSHMPMQEEPREYASAVIDFIANDRVGESAIAAVERARRQP